MKYLIIYLLAFALWAAGEIQCIIKCTKCNWEPIGKAEVWYTVGSCTGIGGVIGWIDIEDK